MKEDVCSWLRKYLDGRGPINCVEVRKAAREAGYTRGELKEAKLECGIVAVSVVYWSLPEGET